MSRAKKDGAVQPAAPSSDLVKPVALGLSQTLLAYFERHSLRLSLEADSPEQRRNELAKARRSVTAGQVILGYWLNQILVAEGRNAMVEAADQNDIGARSAFYAVAQFRLFDGVGDLEAVEALGTIEQSKIPLLALDPKTALAFAHGEPVNGLTIDEVRSMPRQEIEQHVREQRMNSDAESRRLAAEVARLKKDNQALQDDAARRKQGKIPSAIADAREEFVVLSSLLDEHIGQARDLFDELLKPKGSDDEVHRMRAGNQLYVQLMAPAKLLWELMGALEKRFGVKNTEFNEDCKLPPLSADRAISDAARVIEDARNAKQQRRHDRAIRRGHVGRPPKAPSKK